MIFQLFRLTNSEFTVVCSSDIHTLLDINKLCLQASDYGRCTDIIIIVLPGSSLSVCGSSAKKSAIKSAIEASSHGLRVSVNA